MGKGRIAIVGGGISGMVAAIAARRAGADVTVFDTNPSFGKKLLKTGNGRCNFANEKLSPNNYHGRSTDYVKSVLNSFGLEETLEFFRECAVEPKCENGLFYPYSMQAKGVRDCLVFELNLMGIKSVPGQKITGIKTDGNRFILESAPGVYEFEGVILACGGMAAPESGSDGNGYVLAKNLGHKIINPLPALCALVTDDIQIVKAAGTRTDANVSVDIEGKKHKESGNLQITEYGISGICTMQLSWRVSEALAEGKKVEACIDFLPDMKQNQVKSIIENRYQKNGSAKSAADALIGLLPDKLSVAILKKAGIRPEIPAVNVDANQRVALVSILKEYRLNITDARGFSHAQCTYGGVDMKDLDKKSLGSKLVKGLAFCGEILDVCGDCGGYNIQWAVSSGYVAGKALAEGL